MLRKYSVCVMRLDVTVAVNSLGGEECGVGMVGLRAVQSGIHPLSWSEPLNLMAGCVIRDKGGVLR